MSVDGGCIMYSGGRVRGIGWMEGVNVALSMTVEAARQCTKDRKEWRVWYT